MAILNNSSQELFCNDFGQDGKFGGWSVRSPLFYSVVWGRLLNLGGETATPKFTGLAPRRFFIFAALLREEGGGGSEGRGNFSKIRGKKEKGGGEEG